ANGLSAEGYGRYAFYYALIPLIASVADAGIGLVVTREISRDRWSGPRLLGDAILVRAALSALLLGLVAAVALPTLDRPYAQRLLRDGLPFGAAMFVVVLYGRVGVLLLQWLATPADVANFQVAYLLSQPLGFIATALTLAAFPALARHAMGDPAAVGRVLRRA